MEKNCSEFPKRAVKVSSWEAEAETYNWQWGGTGNSGKDEKEVTAHAAEAAGYIHV